jgi:hypothetical protein
MSVAFLRPLVLSGALRCRYAFRFATDEIFDKLLICSGRLLNDLISR